MKIVVIGGVAAGMSAASKARRTNKNAKIEVYTEEKHISYAACGLPYYVKGEVLNSQDLGARTIEQFAAQNITVKINHKATIILPEIKEIKVLDKISGKEYYVDYDKLIIATGTKPIIPPFKGLELQNIFTVKGIPDGEKIKDFLKKESPKNGVIIGGGYIGLEMVEALKAWDLNITLIDAAPYLLGNIDQDMAQGIREYLVDQGVNVRTSEKVIGFKGQGQVEAVVTEEGEIPADIVIIAVGIEPNSQLAKETNIALSVKNAIQVNLKMETNIPDIYAAGDCATTYHLLYGGDSYIPLGTNANKQGKVAGENAAGGNEEFSGTIGTAIIKVMDLEIGRTGLSSREAQSLGKEFWEVKVQAHNKPHFYPGSGNIEVKLIIEKGTNRLLGGQIVGEAPSAKRIDVLATAIQSGLTVVDLAKLDLSYAPPFSPVWDPLLVAANVAVSKII